MTVNSNTNTYAHTPTHAWCLETHERKHTHARPKHHEYHWQPIMGTLNFPNWKSAENHSIHAPFSNPFANSLRLRVKPRTIHFFIELSKFISSQFGWFNFKWFSCIFNSRENVNTDKTDERTTKWTLLHRDYRAIFGFSDSIKFHCIVWQMSADGAMTVGSGQFCNNHFPVKLIVCNRNRIVGFAPTMWTCVAFIAQTKTMHFHFWTIM